MIGAGLRAHRPAAVVLAAALLAAGCAGVQPGAADSAFDSAAANARVYRANIAMEGRMSLQYRQNGKPQAVHGSFVWRQTGAAAGRRTDLRLLSPLGQTLATITVRPGLATLEQAGQPVRRADDVDRLTEQTLGWPLPVAGLGNWLQGYATAKDGSRFNARPHAGDVEDGNDAGSRVDTIDGWRIDYVSWQTTSDAGVYPKRIDLERTTAEAGPVSIRIVIDTVQPPK